MNNLEPIQLDLRHDVVDFLAPNEDADLTTCDREPIHLSGAIQPHGALIAVSEIDMLVRRVSANIGRFLGHEPGDLIANQLAAALGAEPVERLRMALGDPRASGSAPLVLHVRDCAYDLTWYRSDDLVVIELEPAETTVSVSVLFADVRYAMQAMQAAGNVRSLCQVAAEEFAHVTGYDRVMVYQFHPDGHGEVVAENHAAGLQPFLGLHYPASDIPRQARKLYLLNHLRVIVDVDYTPVPLIGVPGAEDLNLSWSSMRSVSPMHLAYLRNMGVKATMTISLMRGTTLWGMLACHHRTAKQLDARARAACRVLGQVFSQQAAVQEDRERDVFRNRLNGIGTQLIAAMSRSEPMADALVEDGLPALALTAADGLVARVEGRIVAAGAVPTGEGVAMLLARLRADDEPTELICDDLADRFPELEPFADRAAGVLALPLSAGYEDFVLWFRGERRHEESWAGDPHAPMIGDPRLRHGEPQARDLGPRESFEAWIRQVRGHSSPWADAEIDVAHRLAAAVPDLLLVRARDRLAHIAMHDSLTGLPNRALLLERAGQALGRSGVSHTVSLMFIDLDRFKLVNDSWGHAAGDNLLCLAAARLTGCVRIEDTVARMGGDEFVVLSANLDAARCAEIAERIVAAFRNPFRILGQDVFITASVGIAVAERGASPAELLRDADTAMYRAKNLGRNAFSTFTDDMRVHSLRRAEIETALHGAVLNGDLQVYFQPLHTTTGILTGFEALSRWPLAGRGMVPPDEFIPAAESMGLIGRLTDGVLEVGLAALARWRVSRPDLNLTLAVNIVASQMAGKALQRSIACALDRHGLPARALCLEITESALVTDDAGAQVFLADMRDFGVRLSIDDFGTGYSALAYLTRLAVHELKIDRAFIADLPDNNAAVTVVASVVGLAHQLGLVALAEGVETEEQLATIRRLGCDLVQGYLLGRPMPADEVDRFLASATLA